jgi:predicted RecB family endonuclease
VGIRFENLVLDLLPSLGLRPIASRYRIIKDGVEVGEVDVLAEDEKGVRYAVEVKAGKIDVSGIRQAYVNALLLNARPLVVCRGYADDAAKKLAEELRVEVYALPDYVFLSLDEVVGAFTLAFIRAIASVFSALNEIDEPTARALAECPDYSCFCDKVKNCEEVFRNLSRRLPASYDALRNLAIIRLAIGSAAHQTLKG